MSPLPVDVLVGIYLGLLVGVIPGLASWVLGFLFRYVTGVTLPGFGVAILAIAMAGVNGGLLALTDRSITAAPTAPRVVTAIVVVAMISMYAHSKGDQLAASFPRRFSLRSLRERTLSLDLAEVVGDRDEVRIHVTGPIADVEGYPPLSEELRAELSATELTFPSTLGLSEIETRTAERLAAEFELESISVSVDERGRASVAAAPPFSGLSKRVDGDRHAVSVEGLLPSGLARGDEVTVITPDAQVRGTVLSARTGDGSATPGTPAAPPAPGSEDGASAGEGSATPTPVRAPTTDGGRGRLTVAVTRTDVQPLVRADVVKIVVESRGTRREYELLSVLRRADHRLGRFSVGEDSPLAGRSIAASSVRDAHDVGVLGVRSDDGWQLGPDESTELHAGDQVFAVGTTAALETFGGVVS